MLYYDYSYFNPVAKGGKRWVRHTLESVDFNGAGWFYGFKASGEGDGATGALFPYPEGIEALARAAAGMSSDLRIECMRFDPISGQFETCVVEEVWRTGPDAPRDLGALFRICGEELLTNTGQPVELQRGDLLELVYRRTEVVQCLSLQRGEAENAGDAKEPTAPVT